jgi:hypothetical protein
MKHPRSDSGRKRAKFSLGPADPLIEAYEPPTRASGLPRAREVFESLDFGRRALPKADRSLTPLPVLTLPDAEAVAASLPSIPTDYAPVPTDGRSRPVTALLLNARGIAEMCDLIEQGFTLSDISEWNGLNPSFLHDAYAKDLCGIRKAFDKAALQCKLHHLKRVKDGSINYQSSTWFLERKFRDEYGKELALNVRPTGPAKTTTWDLGDGKTIEFT